jgi:phospholipid N-methyltransferase
MLKKKLKFDDETLEIIRNIEWNDSGTRAIIVQRLDRNNYVKANKALEAMGGKWSRSEKCHVFEEDPRDQIEGLLETGVIEVDRDGFFPTPNEVIALMLNMMPVNTEAFILEPSAGKGNIIEALLEQGVRANNIIAVEINYKRAKFLEETFADLEVHCDDFMSWLVEEYEFDQIYMNPPFENNQDIKHIMNAFAYLNLGGQLISVMSPHAFFADDAVSHRFRNFLIGKKYKVIDLPANSFKLSGTMVNTKLIMIINE